MLALIPRPPVDCHTTVEVEVVDLRVLAVVVFRRDAVVAALRLLVLVRTRVPVERDRVVVVYVVGRLVNDVLCDIAVVELVCVLEPTLTDDLSRDGGS